MMYRKSQQVHMNVTDMRLQRRVLLIAVAVLLVAAITLGIVAARNAGYRKRAEQQFSLRIANAASAAIQEVNRMSANFSSNTLSRMARIRQYIYYMEQLNSMSMAFEGSEAGRLAPDQAFIELYQDLDLLEAQTQTATSSMDTRTSLLNHLNSLETLLLAP